MSFTDPLTEFVGPNDTRPTQVEVDDRRYHKTDQSAIWITVA